MDDKLSSFIEEQEPPGERLARITREKAPRLAAGEAEHLDWLGGELAELLAAYADDEFEHQAQLFEKLATYFADARSAGLLFAAKLLRKTAES